MAQLTRLELRENGNVLRNYSFSALYTLSFDSNTASKAKSKFSTTTIYLGLYDGSKSLPMHRFLERGIFQQSVNFEFRCHNASKQSALLERILAKGFDKEDNCVFSLFVDSNAMSPSIEIVPKRKLEPGKTLEIFNPIAELPLEYVFEHIDFTLRLLSEDASNSEAQISIKPTIYEQKTLLDLPFKGTCLISDGHDFLAHHRRIPLMNTYVEKMGITANSVRFAYDFMLADRSGNVFKGDGSRLEDFYGWSKPVLSPGDGRVVSAAHDKADNPVGKPFPPIAPEQYERLRMQAFERLEKGGMEELHGNHVIIDHGNGEFSLIDHMQKDSVRVNVGDEVTRGAALGRIGNSGDSGTPHIHYGLQNGKDTLEAEGLPSRFRRFELLLGTTVRRIENLCPNTGMIIKH